MIRHIMETRSTHELSAARGHGHMWGSFRNKRPHEDNWQLNARTTWNQFWSLNKEWSKTNKHPDVLLILSILLFLVIFKTFLQ